MQLSRAAKSGAVALGLLATAGEGQAASSMLQDQQADSWLQVFNGSDKVSVRSLINSLSLSLPKGNVLSLQWNNEMVDIPAVSAPAGSAAAIDAITTASRPISGNAYEDFTKTRNEVTGELTVKRSVMTYYISKETDYLGQQIGVKHNLDLEDRLLNVELGASYGWDDIQPLADDDSNAGPASKTTMHVSVVGTRVLAPTRMLRMGLEYNVINGLQHNPYRNVYAGGTNVPERHPDQRQRRDVFVDLNQYMSNHSSVKLAYRLYDDSWGILSHEVSTELNQYVTHGIYASWNYRYYKQGAADLWREEYATTSGVNGYLTGDYRMSPLSSNLFGFGLNLDLANMGSESAALRRMGVRLDYERYFNSLNYSANFLTTKLVFRF
jgi:hypothetical protein